MRRRVISGCTAVLILIAILTPAAWAQPASSPTYFISTGKPASGGSAVSTSFKATVSFGSGVMAAAAASTNFKILGGFNAAIEAPVTGSPWLSGVRPLYGPLLGGTTHTVHGTELALGTATNVTIGGSTASVSSRAPDQVKATLPAQTTPGWQPVVVVNSGGTATLPQGIGILPMADKPHAVSKNLPFRITYRGTTGDLFYVLVTRAKSPVVIPIPPYHHGLELNLASILGLIGPFPVMDPSGEFHLEFPGIPFTRPIYVQMLGLPTANPGYNPGSFTNVISL